MEQLPLGTLLEVWLDAGEPIEQVPDSLRMEGYQVEQIQDRTDFFCPLGAETHLTTYGFGQPCPLLQA
ncbi:sulfurtransferase TusA family protein [Neosynechococcus sphagnicola]|uniref:sulfurtransferase TusA family protein n=1 Tax=Neosynechococcus sphagnicola TaxID=1501145 RepID=UPI00055D9A8D|nr:hypothetical protein [Neosynechococcus sphagnicola]